MKKMKLARVVFLLLIFSVALPVFAGCAEAKAVTFTRGQEAELLNANAGMAKKSEEYSDGDNIEMVADPYIQAALSWEYSLKVVTENGSFYINDILYDKVTYTDAVEIIYGKDILALKEYVDASVFKTLEAIQQKKGCYLLETECDSKFGKKIAMYEIDGVYYFLNFFENGKVMRIHATNMK